MNRYFVKDRRTGEKKVVDSHDDKEAIEKWYVGCEVKEAKRNVKQESDDGHGDSSSDEGTDDPRGVVDRRPPPAVGGPEVDDTPASADAMGF